MIRNDIEKELLGQINQNGTKILKSKEDLTKLNESIEELKIIINKNQSKLETHQLERNQLIKIMNHWQKKISDHEGRCFDEISPKTDLTIACREIIEILESILEKATLPFEIIKKTEKEYETAKKTKE